MRKLLNTLYVNNPDCFLSLEDENVLVNLEDKVVLKVPLINLENILTCGYRGASTQLMIECAKNGIGISFLSESGRYLGSFFGESKGNILLRKEQFRIADDPKRSCKYARNFIFGKLHNSRWVLERATRDYPLRVDCEKLKKASKNIKLIAKEVLNCEDLDRLMILEGTAAQYYFGEFDQLLLQNKSDFYFKNRNRRPPLDPLNALLSLTYTLLANDCSGALQAVGLDSYCGFLHRDRPGRFSLALDLMEELRAPIADRFVLSLINRKEIVGSDFEKSASGAVSLTEQGRKKFFSSWQEHKRQVITHPFLDEKIEWGLVPYSQALLLSRTIRGELNEYPPFLWK
jgi:CRISPR-associated protein Cas1